MWLVPEVESKNPSDQTVRISNWIKRIVFDERLFFLPVCGWIYISTTLFTIQNYLHTKV